MIIFLYGPDSYRRRKKVKELTNGHLVSQFDFVEESATGEFEKFMSSQSMFESVKFAVLKNFFEYEDAVRFKDVIKNQIDSKSTTLLLNETNEPPGEYEFLKTKPALSQFFGGRKVLRFYSKRSHGTRSGFAERKIARNSHCLRRQYLGCCQ